MLRNNILYDRKKNRFYCQLDLLTKPKKKANNMKRILIITMYCYCDIIREIFLKPKQD